MIEEQIEFRAQDFTALRGTWFAPDGAEPKAIAVIGGATGVPEAFYARLARWLVTHRGVACLTFTYRDMEDPSPTSMRKSRATMADWAITDGQAARDAARARCPGLPIWAIGHSLGGMLLPCQPRLDGISRVVTVASGHVFHREHPMPYRATVYLFWFLLGPICTRLLGYLPGKTIGLGSTLPATVFWQWRRWCTSEDFARSDPDIDDADWSSSAAPATLLAFSDDSMCPRPAVDRLAQSFGDAAVEVWEIDPKARGIAPIGHLNFFSDRHRALWDEVFDPAWEA